MKSESKTIDFLYRTACGRCLLKPLVSPGVSKVAAKLLSAKVSSVFIPYFIKKNKIDMSCYEIPENGYQSFNEFFTRKIRTGYRTMGQGGLICPCDGLLTVSEITADSLFWIKHTCYSLEQLLKDRMLAERLKGGTAFIFRLTPAHYHRYVYCASGTLGKNRIISGILHSVKPICHEKYDVFLQNSREYQEISHPVLGPIVQMEVGALLVGKISNVDRKTGTVINAGMEKGYFEYGGSTVIVLTKRRICLKPKLHDRKKLCGEIPVQMGEALGD